MSYFDNFPEVLYTFGSNGQVLGQQAFQNLNAYADVIDQFKDNIATYAYYNILEGDRPDTLSAQLYGNPEFHWTFFLMNDHLRESGWPLERSQIDSYLAEKYPGTAIVTQDMFYGELNAANNTAGPTLEIGDTVTGSQSSVSGTVTKLDPDNGQIITNATSLFTVGEAVRWRDSNEVLRSISVESSTTHANAIDHYESGTEYADIDPSVGGGILLTEVTIRDMVERRNEELKEIRVIDPRYIDGVVESFQRAMSQG